MNKDSMKVQIGNGCFEIILEVLEEGWQGFLAVFYKLLSLVEYFAALSTHEIYQNVKI